jgi:hypothetical protein
VRGERIKFMIIIIIGNATMLFNALGSTITFSIIKETYMKSAASDFLYFIFYIFFIYLRNITIHL